MVRSASLGCKGKLLLIAGVLWLIRPGAGFAAQQKESCDAQASFAKVGKLIARKEYQSAKEILSILQTCHNLSQLEVFNVGWLYGRAHDFSQALKIFDSVPPEVPDRLTHGYAIALSQFELGRNLAVTPGKVIFQNDLIQLIQYEPTTPTVLKRPLLIVPPWINKFYILDLTPEHSFIKWCVDQGLTVFVISWVNPDAKLATKTFEDYMQEGPLQAPRS